MFLNKLLSGRQIPVEREGEAYLAWWREQFHYCMHGIEIEGQLIPGEYYFFLNFFRINRLDGGRVVFDFPRYCKEDRELFELYKQAEREGKNLLVITGRGYGKSYIGACLLAHSYTFYRKSYNMLGASISQHGIKIWNKVVEGLDNLSKELRHSRIKDKVGHIVSGIEYVGEKGERIRKGFGSEIELVVFGDDSGKARGGRPKLVVLDEVGAWNGGAKLRDCYKAVENSMYRGGVRTGTMLLFGTGGEMKSGGSVEAREMYYNPTAYNLLSFEHNGKRTAYFIPAYKKLEGYYDEHGTQEEEAKRYLDSRRKVLLESGDVGAYEDFVQEMPYTAEEAFLVKSVTPFAFLRERLEAVELMSKREYDSIVKRGTLVAGGANAPDGFLEVKFQVTPLGKYQIIDLPYWAKLQQQPQGIDNRYIAGCDSYDQDKSLLSKSQGAVYVFDRQENRFVAEYVDRPDSVEEFYEGALLLCLMYRCKVMIEHSKIGIISYFKQAGYASLLASAPRLLDSTFIRNSRAGNKIGYAMDFRRKMFAVEKYIAYCKKYKDNLLLKEQLYDHVHFDMHGNEYDRTIACMLCIIYDEELEMRFENKHAGFKLPFWQRQGDRFVFSNKE